MWMFDITPAGAYANAIAAANEKNCRNARRIQEAPALRKKEALDATPQPHTTTPGFLSAIWTRLTAPLTSPHPQATPQTPR